MNEALRTLAAIAAGQHEVFSRAHLTTSERRRQDRRRNELQLAGKIAYFFSYAGVVSEPAYVVGTVDSALAATARAAS